MDLSKRKLNTEFCWDNAEIGHLDKEDGDGRIILDT
jgi:hypothetical protein